MFHAFDSHPADRPPQRAQWMALLARAPMALLEPALGAHARKTPRWLRAPETGLMMVQGRAGGNGERFNLGEVTVTRCALRLAEPLQHEAPVGVAYVLGRSHRHAQLAATADALLQDPAQHAVLDASLLAPVRAHLARERMARRARAQASKVEFFTVARESGSAGEDEEEGA
ncbi:Alpha-D-ribose 1-methylphosphonate 5-triphosphate synthase subunit PhnG (plasmid) [Variovorax sp. SRS16]|uniref:phosphonate C-P lyase system protein PhnG n=1 Tax=Variovorax sp. SRS16 TaxID=282217 RepID=UPI00131931D4|nr:phosphonate C-P lyase system protein PhnG [Variovorax sp. SRS16]VTU46721.1 Alpha-D-ribose 1-methylphosphonate 5-triphosphate synthase subunit PhnG [Variovorax sp. SRS16]